MDTADASMPGYRLRGRSRAGKAFLPVMLYNAPEASLMRRHSGSQHCRAGTLHETVARTKNPTEYIDLHRSGRMVRGRRRGHGLGTRKDAGPEASARVSWHR